MHTFVKLAAAVAFLGTGAQAATLVAASDPSDNASVEASFVAGIGGSYDFLLDFETGFVDEQFVDGDAGVGGLSINGVAQGGGRSRIEQGAGNFGGSNPIGDFALELADDGSFARFTVLELEFTGPLDYLSFFIIDAASKEITINQPLGIPSADFTTNSTNPSGDSALFHGFRFDASENVTRVDILYNTDGSQGFGIDNIAFGYHDLSQVPLPAGLPLMLAGMGAFAVLRRRR